MNDPVLAQRYAETWIDAWNRHDLDDVLRTWSPDSTFTSGRVSLLMDGATTTVRGRDAIRRYWEQAMAPDLRMTLTSVFAGANSIIIGYVNQRGDECAEMLVFDDDGSVIEAVAHHRAR